MFNQSRCDFRRLTVGYMHLHTVIQEEYNEQISELREKLDDSKLELAKYSQSKDMKTTQMVLL